MADDVKRTTRRIAPRLLVCAAALFVGVLGVASAASARSHNGPSIAPRVATFTIPTGNPSTISWTLNLWKKGDLVGSDTATSGTLSVTVPRIIQGTVQADVRRNGMWYSGNRVAIQGRQGGGGTGTGGGTGPGGSNKGGGGSKGGGTGPGGGTGTGGGTGGGGSTSLGGGTGTGTGAGTGGSGTTPTLAPSTAASGASAGGVHQSPGTGAGGSSAGQGRGDPTSAAGTTRPTITTASELAFTGSGAAFWSTGFGGFGLVLLGGFLLMRRRATRQPLT